MKKSILLRVVVLVCTMVMLLAGCGEKTSTTSDKEKDQFTAKESSVSQEVSKETAVETVGEYLSGKHHVNIVIKDKGTIVVELDADAAPITVTNFVNLAKEGFYDGVTFHRIIDGFMMQGGDPTGTGMGGAENNIKGEFAANGVANSLKHTRGAISMARATEMDSASSQFFIVQQDSDYLDGDYACFGYVTEGMDIVDDICKNTRGGDYNGIIPTGNRPVIETIEVVD
ncbi:MAG: peptidylprolyl isomerase [Lachnospiraceae bacterium]|nr:peptidylprolyl isomerase [Lachnospiraceae bacterium]